MIQWRERLYAFLIRRFVGPWLDEESSRQLYQLIDVSIQDGVFVLRDVSLATQKLTSVLKQPLGIRKATIEKLEIHLNLQEHQEGETGSSPESSLAWRAWRLGSAHVHGAVSVVVKILVEGIIIEVEPTNEVTQQTPALDVPKVGASTSTGMFSSYMEAVLASLRLSVDIHGLEVKCFAPRKDRGPEDWLSCRIQSFSYHDLNQTASAASSEDRPYETIMQKAVDVHRVSIFVGSQKEGETSSSTMVALLDGSSRLRLRVVEYFSRVEGEANTERPTQIQHDVDVSLGQKMSFLFDERNAQGIVRIVHQYQASLAQSITKTPNNEQHETPEVVQSPSLRDTEDRRHAEEDVETLNDIMRQYQEARRLAEQNQMRGGMLVPDEDDSNNMTYDVFFDANDQSIYRYSTVMSHCVDGSSEQGQMDFVSVKGRIFLSAGSFKLAFGTTKMEYLLATFSDLSANASVSAKTTVVSMNVGFLEIEESYTIPFPAGGRKRTEISRVLHFVNGEDSTDSAHQGDKGELLLNSACFFMEVKTTKHPDETQCQLNLEPVQVSFNPSTLPNLTLLAQKLSVPPTVSSGAEISTTDRNKTDGSRLTSVALSCPSIDILFPLGGEENLDSMFDRCSYIGDSILSPPVSTCVGVHIEALYASLDQSMDRKSLNLTSNHILSYVASPTKKRSLSGQYRVVDLLCLSSGTVPLSLQLEFGQAPSSDSSHAVKMFPRVPAVASFKARQEDEDEENQIDRVLLSRMGEMGIAAKRELRGKDPQTQMLQNCETCEISVVVRIPHFYLDLSVDECLAILGVLPSSNSTAQSATNVVDDRHGSSSFSSLAFCLQCDHASMGLHHETAAECESAMDSSFVLKLKSLRFHTVLDKGSPRHVRLAAHEIDFLEAKNLAIHSIVKKSTSPEARSSTVLQRAKITNQSATPILYRSHLFKPLSRESPSILLDVTFQEDYSSETEKASRQSVYCTMYDITYRHNVDSKWLDRLKQIFERLNDSNRAEEAQMNRRRSDSLTRLFLEIADCNVDFSTPLRYQNEARLILRLGDVRCSSNLVLPAPAVQAYNISMADLSLCLCSSRHTHNFENSFMMDSELLFTDADTSHLLLDSAEAVRHLNYRTMVLLDNMDAIIAVASNDTPKKNVPKMFFSLTVGEISLYGSKDSFWLLVQTMGEAVGEATAMTDRQMEDLRKQQQEGSQEDDGDTFFDSMVDSDEVESSSGPSTYVNTLDHLRKQSALRPAVGTKSSLSQQHQFLLDGYDWTTIDQAETRTTRMADDEEQTARWYTSETCHAMNLPVNVSLRTGPGISLSQEVSSQSQYPVKIFPHHFPIRPENDPLADGDMGAGRYTGTANPLVSSRVLVHDLRVKLRFFDGYDWPELLSDESLEKKRDVSFLIDVPQRLDSIKIPEAEDNTAETQKSKLMADLLGDQSEVPDTFKYTPLPEEKGARLAYQAKCRRLARRAGKYLQVSVSGVCLRNDSFLLPSNHRLSSCLNLKIQDFFVAETISGNKPLKMVGEWFSENEHPRDSRDGLLMMKVS